MFSGEAKPILPVEAKIIDELSFAEQLKENRVRFFGNGSAKCKDVLQNRNAIFVENVYPSAQYMGTLAYDQFLRKDFVDLVYFEPFYLKEFMIRKPQGNESEVNKMKV